LREIWLPEDTAPVKGGAGDCEISLGIDWAFFGDSWALVAQVVVKHSNVKSIGETVARNNLRSPIPDWQEFGIFTIIY
jgi:hypothetical protein